MPRQTKPARADAPYKIWQTANFEFGFTDAWVLYKDAQRHLPNGCILASPEELALAYKEIRTIREKIFNHRYALWTNQTGLQSSGPHRIADWGGFVSVSYGEFLKLDPRERCWHYYGEGPTVAKAHYIEETGFLAFSSRWNAADRNMDDGEGRARIAFVRPLQYRDQPQKDNSIQTSNLEAKKEILRKWWNPQ